MVWLLAEAEGDVVGAGYALTGWHTPPHRAIGCVLVVPEQRGHGVGDELRTTIERWAREHGATELDAPVAEDDDGSLAWASARGYDGVGPQLPDGARPDRDRARRPSRRRRGSRSSPGPSGPSSPRGSGRSPAKPDRTSRARRRPTSARSRSGSTATWAAPKTGADGVFVALEAGAVARLREALLLCRAHRSRLPRPHRRQAGAARPRHRSSVEGGPDRLGKGERLRVAPDRERGPQRTDPAPEREARLRARAGNGDRARLYRCDLSARSICRLASFVARSRRLSIRSLPRATAISNFTLPSLK